MAKKRRRQRENVKAATAITEYSDPDGNILALRDSVSAGTIAKLKEDVGGAAA